MKRKIANLTNAIMLGIVFTLTMGTAETTLAAQPNVAADNSLPAGDMSHGAANFYKSTKVEGQQVTFKNGYDMKVSGNLFVPKSLQRGQKHVALVVGHPFGAVKEQSANLYAQKMAEQGFVTLAFALSFRGKSAGQPRNTVPPA